MTRPLLLAALLLTVLVRVPLWSQTLTIPAQTGRVEIPAQTVELPDHHHPIPQTVPTAEELSAPGALQDYVNESLTKDGRCVLPPGVIKTDRPIELLQIHGGVIEGSGPAYVGADSKSGWRTGQSTLQASTLIVATDPTRPAIVMRATITPELRNFGIETAGVGVAYQHRTGWGNAFARLHRVSFHGCEIGFKAGDERGDHNAADVTLDGCLWFDCQTGLEVNHQQGVNYLFDGLCYFQHVARAVVFNEGGFSHLDNCAGFGVGTWLTIKGGGPNLMPCRITHLYSDRTKNTPPPVIVDASQASEQVRVVVDGVKVTRHGVNDRQRWPGHVYYRLPANYAEKQSAIRVRDGDLNNYAWGGVVEPAVWPGEGLE